MIKKYFFIFLAFISLASAQDNGAFCLPKSIQQTSLEISERLAMNVGSILAMTTREPWKVPRSCRATELSDDNFSFKDPSTKCSFYSCANRSAEENGICRPGDRNSYFLNYGEKYCKRFSEETVSKLSDKGKIWLNKTLVCLQQSIIDFCKDGNNCNQCDRIRTLAYASHAPCYTKSGLCFLNPADLTYIGWTPDKIKDVLNSDGLSQIGEVGGLCGGRLANYSLMEMDAKANSFVAKAKKWASSLPKVIQTDPESLL